ncbi:sulfur carrier protein ThiS [Rhodocista pekingensis]|uniref:Sulfur carrier protein ThiS n=1 Tax=Rhodocista pekingensis TaxID=201185 RepID=A0ABW2KT11_9PROT
MTTGTTTVNGKPRPDAAGPLLDLLAREGFDPGARGIAVAVNGAVLPRGRWADAAVAEGDAVEIVRIMQGG